MLYVQTELAVTLKIEQMYQESDLPRIQKFANIFEKKLAKRPVK
jgi:flavodoxin I